MMKENSSKNPLSINQQLTLNAKNTALNKRKVSNLPQCL